MREGSIELKRSVSLVMHLQATIFGQDQQAETGGDDICPPPGKEEGYEQDKRKGVGVCGDALCSA
jgi:hypothetical protein